MEILTHRENGGYIIKLRGELDARTSDAVEKIIDEIVKLDPKQIQFDCKELKYISSRGLGVFISRYHEIQNKEIHFSLFNMSNHIKYVFNVLGIDKIISINPEKTVLTN
jgi:anti-sigma B factor antagonist